MFPMYSCGFAEQVNLAMYEFCLRFSWQDPGVFSALFLTAEVVFVGKHTTIEYSAFLYAAALF